MIETVFYLTAYFLAGLSLKYGDDLLDELESPALAWAPLTLSGVLFGLLMAQSEWDFILLLAIIFAVIFSGKVNKPQFIAGFIMIGIVLTIFGLPEITNILDILTILVCLILAGILDEHGNDWTDKIVNPTAEAFFRYRFSLKVSVFLLAVLWPLFLFSAIGLWIFDLGYELTGKAIRFKLRSDKQGYNTHQRSEE